MRRGIFPRLAKLEGPRRSNDAMRAELEALEARYPYLARVLSEEEVEAMSDEAIDDLFGVLAAETGPADRVRELRELLRTPAERAELRAHTAWLDSLTSEELDQAVAGELEFPQRSHRSVIPPGQGNH
jgi:hypothetical protein